MNKLSKIPIPIIPTFIGICTLSNVYLTLGYTWIRHISMIISLVVLIVYLTKIATNLDIVKKEYSNTVPASLYAGIPMLMMILGSYIFDFSALIGKGLWLLGIFIHTIQILVFTYKNVFRGFNRETFVPAWFVTYNGIMVSTVIGGSMNEPLISTTIVYYGIAILFIIMPFMIYRLIKHPIPENLYHTQAIVLAPSSLCVVSYINVIKNPNPMLVYILYALVLGALLFVLYKLVRFLEFTFNPGFAGITFPMAIGIVATIKMSGYLKTLGYDNLSIMLKELSGIQIYLTTAIISFVVYNFMKLLVRNFKEN